MNRFQIFLLALIIGMFCGFWLNEMVVLTNGVIADANNSDLKIKDQEYNVANADLNQSIERFNTAFRNGDVQTLAAMITDDYQHTNGTSKSFGKASWLNYLQKRKTQIESGELVVEDYQISEKEISIYDDMAIVTAKIDVSQTQADSTESRSYRVTNIWVLSNGQWKRAGFHDGRILN